ncbi:MAG: hypothetical protein IID51_08590 [Proteobacteria bacterium]|nr:hypothetical protein [Pseudomonadota bacterium]
MLHVLDVEVVDYDSQAIGYSIFGHVDPAIVTLTITSGTEEVTLTRSREAVTLMLERILAAMRSVPPASSEAIAARTLEEARQNNA